MSRNYELLDTETYKEHLATKKDLSSAALVKGFIPTEVKKEGGKNSRRIRFTISTGTVDRYQDTVNPKGWDLKAWKANPVVLFAHKSNEPPVATGSNIRVEEGKYLRATADFIEGDISPFAETIYQMVSRGYLKATSVGFIPKEYKRPTEEEDPERHHNYGLDFLSQELLEFSIVPVPANPQCLIQAKSVGIDIAPIHGFLEEALDAWADYKGLLLVPREEVEVMRKTADGKQRTSIQLTKRQQASLLEQNLQRIKSSQDAPEVAAEAQESVTDDNAPETATDVSAEPVQERDADQTDVQTDDVVEERIADGATADDADTTEAVEGEERAAEEEINITELTDSGGEFLVQLHTKLVNGETVSNDLVIPLGDRPVDSDDVADILVKVLRSLGQTDISAAKKQDTETEEEKSYEELMSDVTATVEEAVNSDKPLDEHREDILQTLVECVRELHGSVQDLVNKQAPDDEILIVDNLEQEEDLLTFDELRQVVKDILPGIVNDAMKKHINTARGRIS